MREQHNILAGLFLILVGAGFLLANLGILDWTTLAQLWRFWPLLLVLFGVELLLGRSPVGTALTAILLILFLLGAIAYLHFAPLPPHWGPGPRPYFQHRMPGPGWD